LTDRAFEIITCPALTAELRDVLTRHKFRRWINAAEAELFVDRLYQEAESWTDPKDIPPVTGDPKDDYLVALYHASHADLLVSGDSDVLGADSETVQVTTPGHLLAML
jgi:predicted nucleic acid-binding protein